MEAPKPSPNSNNAQSFLAVPGQPGQRCKSLKRQQQTQDWLEFYSNMLCYKIVKRRSLVKMC